MADLAVIMSTYIYDKLDYLEESVYSILNQTYRNFIFFIAMDGPVSPSCENFLINLKDSRIRIFRLEKNEGLAVALNLLLRNVLKEPGIEYIARMDADDISEPVRFYVQRNFLIKNVEVDCIGSWAKKIDDRGNEIAEYKMPTQHDKIKRRFLFRAAIIHPSVMFRKKFILKAGFYPEDANLMEDTVLWGRAFKKGLVFANLNRNLLKFRIDNLFFERRSGLKYGFNLIKKRFIINYLLKTNLTCYLWVTLIGIIKMLPPTILKTIYIINHRLDIIE